MTVEENLRLRENTDQTECLPQICDLCIQVKGTHDPAVVGESCVPDGRWVDAKFDPSNEYHKQHECAVHILGRYNSNFKEVKNATTVD